MSVFIQSFVDGNAGPVTTYGWQEKAIRYNLGIYASGKLRMTERVRWNDGFITRPVPYIKWPPGYNAENCVYRPDLHKKVS